MIFEPIIEEYEGFIIRLTAEEETVHPLDHVDLETAKEARQYLKDIESGTFGWFSAKVTASKYDLELGVDYLGCCDWTSLENFAEHSGYYEDMRAEAIEEAKKVLKKIIEGEAEKTNG